MTNENIEKYIADNKIRIEYKPIKARKGDIGIEGYHYIVKLFKGDSMILETEYSQGLGHMQGYNEKDYCNYKVKDLVKVMLEKGIELKKHVKLFDYFDCVGKEWFIKLKTQKHELKTADILYSLVVDSDCITCGSFEDWCSNYGYDTDSIKANKIYNDCLQIGLKMNSAFNLPELQELFQDY